MRSFMRFIVNILVYAYDNGQMDYQDMSDGSILREIGIRLRRERLDLNLTQQGLANKTGVARRTIQKAEHGEVTTLATLVSILRGLKLLSRLDQFLPQKALSPVQLIKLKGKERRRARSKKKPSPKDPGPTPWTWGES